MRNSEIRRQHKEKSSTVKKIFLFLFIIVFIAGAGAAAGFFLSVSSGLPDISQILHRMRRPVFMMPRGGLLLRFTPRKTVSPCPLMKCRLIYKTHLLR